MLAAPIVVSWDISRFVRARKLTFVSLVAGSRLSRRLAAFKRDRFFLSCSGSPPQLSPQTSGHLTRMGHVTPPFTTKDSFF